MPADYCEFSGLPRDSCGHCRQGTRALPDVVGAEDRDWHGPVPVRGQQDAPLSPGRWFPAEYHGHCSGCGQGIRPGDQIRADGTGGWACEDCG